MRRKTGLHPCARRGMMLLEFMIGLSLIMFMLVLLLTSLGKAREADVMMAYRRQAIYLAEKYLAFMQVPDQTVDLPTTVKLETLQQPTDDERYTWVRLTVEHEMQTASLVGLVCRQYVGDQP